MSETVEVSAMVLLIKRSIAFADWAAGEGICRAGYDDPEAEAKNPDDFLFAYSKATGDEEWTTLADRIAGAFEVERNSNRRLRDRLQAIVDWADLAQKLPDEFNSHGVRLLDGPVFDEARSALTSEQPVDGGKQGEA